MTDKVIAVGEIPVVTISSSEEDSVDGRPAYGSKLSVSFPGGEVEQGNCSSRAYREILMETESCSTDRNEGSGGTMETSAVNEDFENWFKDVIYPAGSIDHVDHAEIDLLRGSIGDLCVKGAKGHNDEESWENPINDSLQSDDQGITESEAERIEQDLSNLFQAIVTNSLFEGTHKEKKERFVWKKLLGAYEKVKHLPPAILIVLQQEIKEYQRIILATGNVWMNVKRLIELFDEDTARRLSFEPVGTRIDARKLYVEHLVSNYSKQINKSVRKIVFLQDKDMDLNDEDSAFLKVALLQERCVTWYDKILKLKGEPTCSKDRIREKPLCLTQENAGTGNAAVDNAIEAFVNEMAFEGAPDFCDLYNIVRENIDQEEASDKFVFKIAEKVFKKVDQIFRARRWTDFCKTLSVHVPLGEECMSEESYFNKLDETDPAELDADLKAKLEQNKYLRRSEEEVIAKFVKKADELDEKKRLASKRRKLNEVNSTLRQAEYSNNVDKYLSGEHDFDINME